MKLEALAALCSLLAAVNAHDDHRVFGRHAHLVQKRQATTSGTSSPVISLAASATSGATSNTVSVSQQASSTAAAVATSAASPILSSAAAAGPVVTGPNGVPVLSQITSGMPTGATYAVSKTYTAGATPSISGAPVLPTGFVFSSGAWPTQDVIPPTDSDEVKEWMQELDGVDIPNISPTADGSCIGDPAAAADAANRGWWTCGGYTSSDDITVCPDKMTWGVSFDDGPGPYTQKLLDYLDQKSLLATFFVVGSRCIERPQILIEEYMAGHEISVHTWSHHALTAMTNEQVVAELGWTRKIIKEVLGVTPTTMRAPFGDIDDRVRAISMAMGLRPIIWTRTPSGFPFDTNDWRVAAGTVTGVDQMATFQSILGNATTMDTGFIVLEHDLYEITVDLAIGYTLDAAQTHNPPFSLKRIGECNKIPMTDMYLETNTNTSFPTVNKSSNSSSSSSSSSGNKANTTGAAASSAAPFSLPATSVLIAIGFALLGGMLI